MANCAMAARQAMSRPFQFSVTLRKASLIRLITA
jgi:hypothetical protein